MEDSHIYLAVSFQRHCSAAFTKQVIIINKYEFMWPPQKFENVIILSITSYIDKNKTKVTSWKFHYFQGTAVRKNCKEPSALYMWNPGCSAYNLCERTEIFKFFVGAKVAGNRDHWALLEHRPDFFSAGAAILLNFNLMIFPSSF